jgi:hypothetical protein
LKKAVDQHDVKLYYLRSDPVYAPLRADLRFRALLAQIESHVTVAALGPVP